MSLKESGVLKYRCNTESPATRWAFSVIGLVVDAPLDEDILRSKVTELVTLWPVLGGQLFWKEKRPWPLSTGSTVDFVSRKVQQNLADYLQIDIYVQGKQEPTVSKMPDIEEVDKKFVFDMPVLPDNVFLLRVTVLRDATLLSFGISHRLADATAQHQVIKAFCDLLSGNTIPELILPPDARGTNMSELVIPDTRVSDIPSVDYKTHQNNFMGGFFPIVKLVLKTLWTEVLRMIGLRERLEGKFVYLPGPWVNGVRNAALESLKTQTQPGQHDGVEPTKNDIIAAWLLKTIYDRVPRSDDPVDFYGPLNYRSVIPPPPAGTTWIHDSAGPLRHQLTVAQIQTESIATLARGLRLTTLRYKQASSIREYLRFCEDHVTKTLIPYVRKPSWNLPLTVVSSWTTLDFAALDFSGAAPEKRKAKVVFVNPIARGMRSGFWPSAFTIKDKDGGYWVRAYMTPSGWKHLYHCSN